MFLNRYMSVFLVINIFLTNPSFALQLLSHKATYTLNVENIKNSLLEGGQGQTFFEIQEVCDGWNVREDYALMYELPNKKSAKSYSIAAGGFWDTRARVVVVVVNCILFKN